MNKFFKTTQRENSSRSATPALARQINIRKVVDVLRSNPPLTRAAITRLCGMTSPTMTKLVSDLQKTGIIREVKNIPSGRGRPSKCYTLSEKNLQVFGAVIGFKKCRIFTAPISLELKKIDEFEFATPLSYDELVHQFRQFMQTRMEASPEKYLGFALSTPGLIENNEQRIMICPNIRYLDAQCPALDISRGFDLKTITIHEEHALCIAEQTAGNAGDLADFAMLDVREGMGVGVVSGGRYIKGHCGFSGEVGHIPVVPDGLICGCGKTGCLETVATDTALLKLVNEKHNLHISMDELIKLLGKGTLSIDSELDYSLDYLARGIGIIINMYNPGLVLLNSAMFDLASDFHARLEDKVKDYAMVPSCAVCGIKRTSASRDAGVLACISNSLVDSIVD